MSDILSKEYASFMENTLRSMTTLPVEGICIITKLNGGAIFTNYFNSSMMDKIAYAGIIQQDATIDTLRASKLLREGESDDN